MSSYVTEAFKQLELLNEEAFDIDEQGIEDFKEFATDEDTVDIIDMEAEDELDLEDSYVGKVVLDCCVCHSKIYKDADSVVVSEDGEIANEGDECPYCYSVDGYKIIGQIAPFEEDSELKVEIEDKDGDGKIEDDEVEVSAEEKDEVKESFLKRKRARIIRECKNTKKFKKSIRLKEEDEAETIEDKIEDVVNDLSDEAITELTTQMIIDYIVDNLDDIENEEVQEVVADIEAEIPNDDAEVEAENEVEVEDEPEAEDDGLETDDIMFEVGIEEGCKGKKSVKENKNRQIRSRILKEAKKVRAKRIAEAAKKKSAKKLTESKHRKLIEAMTEDELRSELESVINSMDATNDRVMLWNNYCDEAGYYDDEVYVMDELDDILVDMKPWDAIRAAFYGDFNPNHSFWKFNGYGNLVSADYIDEFADFDAVVDFIIENQTSLDSDEIAEVLEIATEEVDESLGEDFERVELETDDSVIKVTEEPKEEEDFSDVDFTDFSSIDLDDEPIEEESTDEEEVEAEEEEEPIGESVKKKSGKRLQENKAKIAKVRPVKEDFERVELETEDKVIKVSEEPKEETPDAEMIEPLDLGTEAEIVGATNEDSDYEEEAEGEDGFIDQDFDEFEEEDFDELGESYLKRVYDNVKSFKTSKVSTKGNTLKLEGVIKFASGNSKTTTFLFEAKDITKRGKVRFIGENQQITRGKKAFTLTGSVKGRKLISESLNYNYRAKGADGKSVKLYGTIKRK